MIFKKKKKNKEPQLSAILPGYTHTHTEAYANAHTELNYLSCAVQIS